MEKQDAKRETSDYVERFQMALSFMPDEEVSVLSEALFDAWREKRRVLICGNGGSAGNAMHLANDFLYGVGAGERPGLDVEALPSNPSVLTCLANDVGYDDVFSEQIKAKARSGDLLLVLSGSGNSKNVIKALNTANQNGLETHAILGFSGGDCKLLADNVIHIPIDDMQIAEDMQLVVGHICMKVLFSNRGLLDHVRS